MIKADLVAKISEESGITKVQAEKALATFMTSVATALRENDKVTLVGFGTFSPVKKAARTGRNPQTGKPIKIPAKVVGKFTPGKDLKDLSVKLNAKSTKKADKTSSSKTSKKK